MVDAGRYIFNGDTGFGAAAAEDRLHPEMAELDLAPGTSVTVAGMDEDRNLVLVEWTDRAGTARITSVEPDQFAAQFTREV